jgi:hypothetical protein
MTKIPVGETVASAYRFAFVELEKIIGAIWLPAIVLTIIDYFVNGSMLAARGAAMSSGDASQLAPVVAGQIGYVFIALLLKAVIAVAICREILKPLERPQWLRFSLGGAEFRFVGTMLALVALVMLIALLCMIAGTSMVAAVPVAGLAAAEKTLGMAALIALLLSPALIYLFVRLGTLALPGVVLEGGIGLERSWTLLKGNVGRMLIIMLAVGVPVMLVYLLLYGMILGPDSFLNPHINIIGDAAARQRYEIDIVHQTAARLPWLEGLNFILAPFLYGLWFAAPAFAYKALTKPKA